MGIKWGKPIVVPLTGTTSSAGLLQLNRRLEPLGRGELYRLTQFHVWHPSVSDSLKARIFAVFTGDPWALITYVYGQPGIVWEGSLIFPQVTGDATYSKDTLYITVIGALSATVNGFLVYQKGRHI